MPSAKNRFTSWYCLSRCWRISLKTAAACLPMEYPCNSTNEVSREWGGKIVCKSFYLYVGARDELSTSKSSLAKKKHFKKSFADVRKLNEKLKVSWLARCKWLRYDGNWQKYKVITWMEMLAWSGFERKLKEENFILVQIEDFE